MLDTEPLSERLLPNLPAAGDRDGKIMKFADDVLTWVADTVGATAAQIALLLPELPAAGSRDGKIPKFNNDDLEWQEDESGSSDGFEQRYELVEVPTSATAMSFGIKSARTALKLALPPAPLSLIHI